MEMMNIPSTRLQRTKSIIVDQIIPENGSAGVTPHSVHIIIAVCGRREAIQQICYKVVRYLTWKGQRTKLFSTRSASLPASPTSRQQHISIRMAFEAAMNYTDCGGISVLDSYDVKEADINWMLENSNNIKLLWIVAGSDLFTIPPTSSFIHIEYGPIFKVTSANIRGAVCKLVHRFVSHLRLIEVPIFISRHGESSDNMGGFLGGNSSITERGEQFAVALGRFIDEKNLSRLQVWTSSLKRAVATAAHIRTAASRRHFDCLQEINAGDFTGLTYAEIKKRFPEEYEARKRDKLGYRYPNGESYIDIINRIDNVILEIESADFPILIVSHKAVLRCLLGYFLHKKRIDIPESPLPSHSVCELKYTPEGIIMDTYEMGIDHVENMSEPAAKPISKETKASKISCSSKETLSCEMPSGEPHDPKLS